MQSCRGPHRIKEKLEIMEFLQEKTFSASCCIDIPKYRHINRSCLLASSVLTRSPIHHELDLPSPRLPAFVQNLSHRKKTSTVDLPKRRHIDRSCRRECSSLHQVMGPS